VNAPATTKSPAKTKPRAVKRSRYRIILENLAQSTGNGTLAEMAKWALDEIRKGRLRATGGVDLEQYRRDLIDEVIRIVEGEAEPTVAGSRLEMERAEAMVTAVRGVKRSLVRRLEALRALVPERFA
jgi:hypothetical protein